MNQELSDLVKVVHFLAERNWVPATSSNFSIKESDDRFFVSSSGIDKGLITEKDFLLIDGQMQIVDGPKLKPSAETLIHVEIYRQTGATCVLHTHSDISTVLSMVSNHTSLSFTGYEIEKAFPAISSHEQTLEFPVIENSQDMPSFCRQLAELFQQKDFPGFVIKGHGIYTWGASVAAAKRHIEAMEFLLRCRYMEMQLK